MELALPAGCAMDGVLAMLSRRWTAHVVWLLGRNGETRFGALRRALPGRVSARVLSARLKDLQELGLVARRISGKYAVSYGLTRDGRAMDAWLRTLERRAANLSARR